MKRRFVLFIAILILIGIGLVAYKLSGDNVAVLRPAGIIAEKQRALLIFASILSLVVILPVFALTFFIAFRYRESNHRRTKYTPDWDHQPVLETLWWGIPIAIIVILGVVTWQSSHQLDPYREIASSKQPLTIEVVALQWKWLFIYPEQHIASVNFVQFPTDQPLAFHITADAPMNSFWIPQLGGQIYAMPGMTTQLHLMADKSGDYQGSSANISGSGFADMKFIARASSENDFKHWVREAHSSGYELTADQYRSLARPGAAAPPFIFNMNDTSLYDTIVMNYMMPQAGDIH